MICSQMAHVFENDFFVDSCHFASFDDVLGLNTHGCYRFDDCLMFDE